MLIVREVGRVRLSGVAIPLARKDTPAAARFKTQTHTANAGEQVDESERNTAIIAARYSQGLTDVHTPEQRSYNMSHIRGRDTAPEMRVRRILHAAGLRYRLHGKSLPGKPDLVFAGRKTVVFVHGCFWHMHSCKYGKPAPATNRISGPRSGAPMRTATTEEPRRA